MKRGIRLRGFALVELLIVVTVCCILAALLAPVVRAAWDASHRKSSASTFKQSVPENSNSLGEYRIHIDINQSNQQAPSLRTYLPIFYVPRQRPLPAFRRGLNKPEKVATIPTVVQ